MTAAGHNGSHLPQLLRDLVARQGSGVMETAEGFRAALDDFLSEDEATTGELNLLVDAVRLGAVNRLLSILDHGGDAVAAVREAGDAFARDRGTDDVARCRWAVAIVGHALDRVDEAVVRASGVPGFSASAPPPIPPPATGPPSRTLSETQTETETAGSAPAPAPAPPTGAPSPPAGWTPDSATRRRTALIGLLVATVVAAAVVVGIWLGSRDDDPDEGGDGTASGIPDNSVVLPVTDDNGESRIYAVDVDSGDDPEPLTEGPGDRLPTISPDRTTLIYLEGTPGGSTRPIVMDVTTGETHPLFGDDGACDFAARPGFSPDGDRLVVLCLNAGGDYLNTAVVDLRGRKQVGVASSGTPLGTPTWTSENTLAYALGGTPSTLWTIELSGFVRRPLTDGSEGWDSHPDWSEQAGLLLFSRHEGEGLFGDLLTLDADEQLGPSTEGKRWAHPAWSPDGDRVVFTERDSDGTERLAVASLDEDGFSDAQYVDDLPGDPGVPAWGSR